MTVLACLAAMVLSQQDDRPRIKEDLPNGVKVLVSEEPYPDRAVISVLASTRGMEDTLETQGQRHLLEHILAKGPAKDADRKLETVGAILEADTTRSGLWITVSGPSSQLPMMLTVCGEVVSSLVTTEEELERELKILRQEEAVLPGWWPFEAAAWTVAFGESAVDPFGDLSSLEGMTTEGLADVHRRTFDAHAVSVVVTGDIDAGTVVLRCREAFGRLRSSENLSDEKRRPGQLNGNARVRAKGESRSVIVPGMTNGKTAAAIGIASVLASRLGGQVLYDPDLDPGLVTLWSPRRGALAAIDEFGASDVQNMTGSARALAHAWFRGLSGSETGRTELEAMLLQARSVTTIDVMDSYPLGATDREVVAAFQLFRKGTCIEVNGQ